MQSLNLELPSIAEIRQEKARQRKELMVTRASDLQRRRFEAALQNRLTSDFIAPATSINAELRAGLRPMRNLSRHMAHNEGYMKRFLSLLRSNVIGPRGIRLQVRAKVNGDELDTILNKQVEVAWSQWCHKENCTVSGKLTWVDAQNLAVTQLARDGECLIRKVTADNPFGFALKFIDVAYLDETYNQILPNGNRVLMSVEVDNDDRPIAYYLTTPYYDYLYPEHGRIRERVRVPAGEMIHLVLIYDDESATRGYPWAFAAMKNLRQLGAYVEAKVIGARVEACQMAFLIPPKLDLAQGQYGDDDSPGMLAEIEAQPAIFPELPPGYDVKTFDPKHPNGQEGEFLKAMLKGISVGVDADYCTFTSDMREVNFSSIRMGVGEVREIYKGVQQFVGPHLIREVYLGWLRSSFMTGAIEGVLPSDFNRLTDPRSLPRGWGYVNPLQDAKADEQRLKNRTTSRTRIAADEGEDLEEIFQEWAEEEQLAKKYGIKLISEAPQRPVGDPTEVGEDSD